MPAPALGRSKAVSLCRPHTIFRCITKEPTLKLNITVDGKTYEVDVEVAEDDRPQSGPYYYVPPQSAVTVPSVPLAPPPAPPVGGGNVAEDKVCRSPIAGVVVRVTVQVGQQIQANDPLLVLEAMKM